MRGQRNYESTGQEVINYALNLSGTIEMHKTPSTKVIHTQIKVQKYTYVYLSSCSLPLSESSVVPLTTGSAGDIGLPVRSFLT